MKRLILHLALTFTRLSGFAQGNEIVMVTTSAPATQGKVVSYDGSGLEGVKVSACNAAFDVCKMIATTKVDGSFTFEKGHKTYYLQFLFPGLNQVRATVNIRKGSRPLEIVLHPGT